MAVHRYDDLVRSQPGEFAWPDLSIYLHSLSLCTANAVALSASDRGLIVVPMFHANAWGYPHAIFWCGGDLILPHRFLKPGQLVSLMEVARPTFVNVCRRLDRRAALPARTRSGHLLDHPDRGRGSATPRALMQAFGDEYDIPLTQGWGMTETSPLVTLARPRRQQWARRPWRTR